MLEADAVTAVVRSENASGGRHETATCWTAGSNEPRRDLGSHRAIGLKHRHPVVAEIDLRIGETGRLVDKSQRPDEKQDARGDLHGHQARRRREPRASDDAWPRATEVRRGAQGGLRVPAQ